jgi:signal peptidase I
VVRAKFNLKNEIASLALVIALVTFARSSLADHYYVPSGSMEYTLMPGDRVVVDKTAYGFRVPLTKIDLFPVGAPQRGEIAVFDSPTDGLLLIKRIVAVGGDRVELNDGYLTINDVPLRADADSNSASEDFDGRFAQLNFSSGGGPNIGEFAVPPNSVLVLGDHRGNSHDGRYFGTIDERELYGRAVGIYYRRNEGLTWEPL